MQTMTEFSVADALRSDLPELKRLLAETVPDCAPQTVWELPFHWSSYRVIRNDADEVIAAASLQALPGRRAEIRGLVVDPNWRGKGLANILVEDLLARAEAEGREAVCVTRNPSFFARHGFQYTFPTWLTRKRHVRQPSSDDAPRVCMISCGAETA
jgi:N-acetylglutamate synthase-like GNAT family acetyltransferase